MNDFSRLMPMRNRSKSRLSKRSGPRAMPEVATADAVAQAVLQDTWKGEVPQARRFDLCLSFETRYDNHRWHARPRRSVHDRRRASRLRSGLTLRRATVFEIEAQRCAYQFDEIV